MYGELLKIRESRHHMEKRAQHIHIYPGAPTDDVDLKAHLIEAMQNYADLDAAHQAAQQEKDLGMKHILHLLGGIALGAGAGAGIGAAVSPSGLKGSGAMLGSMLGVMPGAIVGAIRANNEEERLYPGVAQRKHDAWAEKDQARQHLGDLALLDPKLYERQRILSGIQGVPKQTSFEPVGKGVPPLPKKEEEDEQEWH
jgi:hypothetical protein